MPWKQVEPMLQRKELIEKMVPGAGLEPARGCPRGILSPLRLPNSATRAICEAEVGIEPAYTALQAAA